MIVREHKFNCHPRQDGPLKSVLRKTRKVYHKIKDKESLKLTTSKPESTKTTKDKTKKNKGPNCTQKRPAKGLDPGISD